MFFIDLMKKVESALYDTNITSANLKAEGFIYVNKVWIKTISKQPLILAKIYNKSSLLNLFTERDLAKHTLTISGMEHEDNCTTHSVKSMQEIKNNIAKFNISSKSLTRFIAKFLALIFISLLISFLLGLCTH